MAVVNITAMITHAAVRDLESHLLGTIDDSDGHRCGRADFRGCGGGLVDLKPRIPDGAQPLPRVLLQAAPQQPNDARHHHVP
jgi:hypothetical protein